VLIGVGKKGHANREATTYTKDTALSSLGAEGETSWAVQLNEHRGIVCQEYKIATKIRKGKQDSKGFLGQGGASKGDVHRFAPCYCLAKRNKVKKIYLQGVKKVE